jgi:toxin YoeB
MDEKEIKWSLRALHDKIDILEYWINRIQSKAYSQKLDKLFDQAINEIARFPDLGKLTDFKNIRVKILSHYLIFYRI